MTATTRKFDELIAGVRDEANEYLDRKFAEMKKVGVAKVSALSKEGSPATKLSPWRARLQMH